MWPWANCCWSQNLSDLDPTGCGPSPPGEEETREHGTAMQRCHLLDIIPARTSNTRHRKGRDGMRWWALGPTPLQQRQGLLGDSWAKAQARHVQEVYFITWQTPACLLRSPRSLQQQAGLRCPDMSLHLAWHRWEMRRVPGSCSPASCARAWASARHHTTGADCNSYRLMGKIQAGAKHQSE